jgi:hypothetical protein
VNFPLFVLSNIVGPLDLGGAGTSSDSVSLVRSMTSEGLID